MYKNRVIIFFYEIWKFMLPLILLTHRKFMKLFVGYMNCGEITWNLFFLIKEILNLIAFQYDNQERGLSHYFELEKDSFCFYCL